IANGADIERLRTPVERPAGLPVEIRERNYFLFLGRLVERKGVDLLIEALQGSSSASEAHLVIAGSGEQQQRLKSLVANRGLTNRVHFLGDVSGDLKCFLLQNSICTVMPSRIAEGASLVLLESFAAGRPVIGTAISGLLEAIRHGETGWLVPEESSVALAAALSVAIEDRKLIEQMGQTARHAALRYDWRSIAEQHLALYERLLPNPARRIAA
ncbi:MAG: glycosyltransferase family 4 protein, partial [Planctomycetota bacterium]